MEDHKHQFGSWKKLIFTKIRYCKSCGASERKDLVFKDEKKNSVKQ